MVKFRKFLAIIYIISFVLAVGALSAYWFNVEPIASFMADNRGQTWLDYFLCITMGIAALGAVVFLVRTLTLRSKKSFQRSKNEYGTVQISRATMVREVNAVLDKHPEVKRLKTFVTIKNRRRKPYVNVEVRVSPRGSLEMPEVAAGLQSEVKAALERLTGNAVHTVTIDVRKGTSADDAKSGKQLAEKAGEAPAGEASTGTGPEADGDAVGDAGAEAGSRDAREDAEGKPDGAAEPADSALAGADAADAVAGGNNADAAVAAADDESASPAAAAAAPGAAEAAGSAVPKKAEAAGGESKAQDGKDNSAE